MLCERLPAQDIDKYFSRGHLYRILQNRIYLGEVVHQDQSYPGEHQAIIGPDLWNRVEQVFAANRRGEMNGAHSPSGALLKGLIFDDAGNRMSPIQAVVARRPDAQTVKALIATTCCGKC